MALPHSPSRSIDGRGDPLGRGLWWKGEQKPLNYTDHERIGRTIEAVEDRAPQDEPPATRESLVGAIHRLYRKR